MHTFTIQNKWSRINCTLIIFALYIFPMFNAKVFFLVGFLEELKVFIEHHY